MSTAHRRYGEGSVFKRKDGKWCAELDYTDGRARRRRARRTRSTERAAKAALDDLKREMAGTLKSGPTTLGKFLTDWLKSGSRKSNTNRSYSQVVTQHIAPFLGNLSFGDLNIRRLQRWVADLAAEGRSAHTIRYARTVLRSALTDAQRLELLATNPAKLVKVPTHRKRRPQHFSAVQLDRLLRSSQPWLACWIYVTAVLGMRRGETLGLQWDDLDYVTHEIHVHRQITEDGSVDTLKTEKSRRSYTATSPGVWKALSAQRRRIELAFVGKTIPDWIWPTSSGGPIAPSNLERSFRQARTAAGLQGFRLHDLRATAIGRIIASRPVKDAQEWVGHEDPRTTLGYDEMTPDRQLLTSQAIDRATPSPDSE
jgi:integrase